MNEKEISMDYSIQSSRITPNSPTSSPSSLIPTLLLSSFLALFSKSSLSETSHRWNGTNKYILNRLFFFFGHTHTHIRLTSGTGPTNRSFLERNRWSYYKRRRSSIRL